MEFHVHGMSGCEVEIALIVSVSLYKVVDVIPLLCLVRTSDNDTAVLA